LYPSYHLFYIIPAKNSARSERPAAELA